MESTDTESKGIVGVSVRPSITCVDVLWLLEDGEHEGGFSTKTLHDVLIRHDHGHALDIEHHISPVVVCAS